MGIKLRQVESTNDKGLVGVTEAGEEVPLSAPKPNILIVGITVTKKDYNNNESKWLAYLARREQGELENFTKILPEDKYIHFFERQFTDSCGPCSDRFVIPYNVYTRRK